MKKTLTWVFFFSMLAIILKSVILSFFFILIAVFPMIIFKSVSTVRNKTFSFLIKIKFWNRFFFLTNSTNFSICILRNLFDFHFWFRFWISISRWTPAKFLERIMEPLSFCDLCVFISGIGHYCRFQYCFISQF